MRHFLTFSILAFVCSGICFAQIVDDVCPKLSVNGPRGIGVPGEPMVFVLVTEGDVPDKVGISWSVENGEITEGKDTRAISVVTKQFGVNIKATATVKGLQDVCEKTATVSVPVIHKPEWESIDQWGSKLKKNDQRGRLDAFFIELADNPTNMGLFLIGLDKTADQKAKWRRINFILDHAKFRKFDKDRLVFAIQRGGFSTTILYRYPPEREADLPCDKCEIIYGRDVK